MSLLSLTGKHLLLDTLEYFSPRCFGVPEETTILGPSVVDEMNLLVWNCVPFVQVGWRSDTSASSSSAPVRLTLNQVRRALVS